MMHLWIQRGIYEAIREASAPGLLDECQKLKGRETGKCKVTLVYKLPANNVFHLVRPRNKMRIGWMIVI